MKSGIELIADERLRQITNEGNTAEHDDTHEVGELCGAGASYADVAHRQIGENFVDLACTRPVYSEYASGRPPSQTWRWDGDWWKPSEDPIRNLEKAGALIAAEIDRLLRARERGE